MVTGLLFNMRQTIDAVFRINQFKNFLKFLTFSVFSSGGKIIDIHQERFHLHPLIYRLFIQITYVFCIITYVTSNNQMFIINICIIIQKI